MPIPGPAAAATALDPAPTGSPFWLLLNGTWLQLEGVVPGVTVGSDRPGSSVTTEGGHRYEQRARAARRSWDVTLPFAAGQNLAALRVAADTDAELWLLSDAVAAGNMLANRDCWGAHATRIDCSGMPLPALTSGDVVTGRIRGGVPTTLSCWSTSTDPVLNVVYPGSAGVALDPAAAGQASLTFTPTTDGIVTITALASGVCSGLMLTEGATAPTEFTPGEAMPCKVVVDDPGDVLRTQHAGVWRHDYTVQLREVG